MRWFDMQNNDPGPKMFCYQMTSLRCLDLQVDHCIALGIKVSANICSVLFVLAPVYVLSTGCTLKNPTVQPSQVKCRILHFAQCILRTEYCIGHIQTACRFQPERVRYSQVQPDTARYSQVERGTASYSQLQPGPAMQSQVQTGTACTVRWNQIQPGTARQSQVEPGTAR